MRLTDSTTNQRKKR